MDCGHNPKFEYLTQMHLEIIIFNIFFFPHGQLTDEWSWPKFFFIFIFKTNKQTNPETSCMARGPRSS